MFLQCIVQLILGKMEIRHYFLDCQEQEKQRYQQITHRQLIGDDEHGWSRTSVFNFEGGCYAKCINLSQKNEPDIWDAVRFGAMAENVCLFEDTRIIDFDDDSITENTRVGYPLEIY